MPLPKRKPDNHKARKRMERAASVGKAQPTVNHPNHPTANSTAAGSPIPEVTDLDCALPTRWRELLPKWEDLTTDEQRYRGPFCDAVSSLFFNGGKLADHGITMKSGIDGAKVMRYIRATLGDFGPSHEHKIGGIAHMLAKWCDIKSRRAA